MTPELRRGTELDDTLCLATFADQAYAGLLCSRLLYLTVAGKKKMVHENLAMSKSKISLLCIEFI